MDEMTKGGADAGDLRVHRTELWLSRVLRGGVVISTVMVLIGLVLTFMHHPGYFSAELSAATVIKEMAFPHSVDEVFVGVLHGQGRALIVLGLFFLIATPVARVAMSVVIFLHLRDQAFTIITLIVLVLLVISFFLGHGGG